MHWNRLLLCNFPHKVGFLLPALPHPLPTQSGETPVGKQLGGGCGGRGLEASQCSGQLLLRPMEGPGMTISTPERPLEVTKPSAIWKAGNVSTWATTEKKPRQPLSGCSTQHWLEAYYVVAPVPGKRGLWQGSGFTGRQMDQEGLLAQHLGNGPFHTHLSSSSRLMLSWKHNDENRHRIHLFFPKVLLSKYYY